MSDTSGGPGWWQASDGKWYPPPTAAPVAPVQKPPRQWKTWQVVAIGAAALFVGVGIGAASQGEKTKATVATATTVRPAPTTAAAVPKTTLAPTTTLPPTTVPTTVPGPKTTFGSGTYRVGTDIAPGTYIASGAQSSCYWERLSGFGGGMGEIVANNFGDPGIVTIDASDAGFKTSGCGTWTKT